MRYSSMEEWKIAREAKYKNTIQELKNILQNSDGSMEHAIELSLNMVCHDVKAEAGTFWFYSKYGDGLIHPRAQFGGKEIKNLHLEPGEGIAGQVVQSGRPTVVTNCQSDPRWASKVDNNTGFVTKSMICIPLRSSNEVFGCIQLINKVNDSLFDMEDMELVTVLGEEISNQFYELNLLSDGRTENKVAVMFADIRGFTNIAKTLAPECVAQILNRYLSFATKHIRNNSGVADKYIGDCAMAYWVEKDGNDAIYKACKTAKQMIDNKAEIQKTIKEKYNFDIDFGIGIAYGPAFVGNIGTPVLSDHTVVGNTVNVAAYLQDIAPKGDIYLDIEAYNAIKDKVDATLVDKNTISNKKIDIDVYSLSNIK